MKLRRWAEARFSVPVHHHRRPRWRSPFHPLYKPNVECSMLPTGWPTPHDVEDLVCGRYIESDRSARCWRLVNEWLTHLSWGWTEIPMSVARFEELDRDLAAAGLPSTYSLKQLMDEDPQIPLRPAPGMKIGYAGTRQILATWVELSEVIGTVPIARRGEVNAVLKFLSLISGVESSRSRSGPPGARPLSGLAAGHRRRRPPHWSQSWPNSFMRRVWLKYTTKRRATTHSRGCTLRALPAMTFVMQNMMSPAPIPVVIE